MNHLFISSFIAAGFAFTKGGYWWWSFQCHWLFLLIFLSVWIGLKIADEYRFSLGIVFAYTCISGVTIFSSRGNIFSHLPLMEVTLYRANSGQTAFAFAMIVLFFFIYRNNLRVIEKTLVHFSWLAIVFTFGRWYLAKFKLESLGGTFGNPSINLCFLIFAMPIFLHYYRHTDHREFKLLPRWQGVAYIVSILTLLVISTKLAPILVLIGVCVAYDFAKERRIPWLTMAMVGIPSTVYVAIMGIPLDSHGRYKVWEWAMQYWHSHDAVINGMKQVAPISKWFGSGNGTAAVMVPMIQAFHNDREGYFLWMHSDVLQSLFEMGIIGVIVYAILGIDTLVRSFNRPYLFSSVVGIGLTMLANYPMRMAFQAFFITWVVFESLEPYVAKLPFKDRDSL